jgi:hypothetical protein
MVTLYVPNKINNVVVIIRSVFEIKTQQAAKNSLKGSTTTTGSSNTLCNK